MPKVFANQLSSLPATLRVGKERKVSILSDSMGVTLNRGQDGIIRVLMVAPDNQGSKFVRRGAINPGDIIREAAGVDLRRPLTQVMWSDTVAFMKFSPRPLHIVVAKELSEKPPAVQEEFAKAGMKSMNRRPDPPRGFDPPSRASGSESVSEALSASKKIEAEIISETQEEEVDDKDNQPLSVSMLGTEPDEDCKIESSLEGENVN